MGNFCQRGEEDVPPLPKRQYRSEEPRKRWGADDKKNKNEASH